MILTNPPYLSRTSNSRKKINHLAFNDSNLSDLYQISLKKMFNSKMPGIAIIPETFINSKFSKKYIYSITILIPNPFEDTQIPVCIICFDPNKEFTKTIIYKNAEKIGNLEDIKLIATKFLKTKNKYNVKFNVENGELALIGFDSQKGKKIHFLKSENLKYKRPQKISSRLISKIKINSNVNDYFINELNEKLNKYRELTKNILFSPFKGNIDKFFRRRRLDYKTARKIINSI